MAGQRKKIVIVEDKYRQYQIIRELLKHNYDILPDITNDDDFRLLRSDLMQFLKEEKNEYLASLGDYENADAFIVDFELKINSDKTGILFCELTECIYQGLKPALFLTIISKADVANEISTVEEKYKAIICDSLRKPEFWDDESLDIDTVISKPESKTLRNDIKIKLDGLIERSIQKNQPVHDTTE